jgi:DNA-binding transcriptional regulator PaaX
MGIKKYKYYFKKPRSEIVKDILRWLALSGAIIIAAQSPFFVRNLVKNFLKFRKYPRGKLSSTFYKLKRKGLIRIRKVNHQIYISLTEEGKKMVGWMQIDSLIIKRPKKWDGFWRIVIFDISELKKVHREAFRGKLKELGFYPIQKSVWVHPFDCQAEIELLREFFGLNEEELRLIVSNNIGNDKELKKIFKL